MDFFARQDRARAQTGQLLGLFALAVTVVVAVVTAAITVVLVPALRNATGNADVLDPGPGWWQANAPFVALCALAVLAVVLVGTAFKMLTLQGGGAVVARAMGGDLVDANTTDPLQRRLLNVVEEMAMASGVPVPAVYVLGEEAGINAFAAGNSTADSVVAVTRGALERLDRAELQGVIAHEFSHILNGDMRLNMRLLGFVGGLFAIAMVGRVLLRGSRGSSRKNGGGIALVGFAMFVMGYIGVAMGRMIQAAISRQREFLADASAVQFTRDPSGLRDALVKIGASGGSHLVSHETGEVAHMLFASGLDGLFATHPPLAERIRALDPSFTAEEFQRESARMASEAQGTVTPMVSRLVAQPRPAHLEFAGRLRDAIPAVLLEDAGDPQRAVHSLWALLLSQGEPARAHELGVLAAACPPETLAGVEARREAMAALPAGQRMPLLLRLIPALGRRPLEERRRMLDLLERVIRADGSIGVAEYALARLARVHLGEQVSRPAYAPRLAARDLEPELQILFSVLAHFGHADAATAAEAYDRGMRRVLEQPSAGYRLPADWVPALDGAFERLDHMRLGDKAQLVNGLAAVVSHDRQIGVTEAELMRAMCGSLHCPLPPFLRSNAAGDTTAA